MDAVLNNEHWLGVDSPERKGLKVSARDAWARMFREAGIGLDSEGASFIADVRQTFGIDSMKDNERLSVYVSGDEGYFIRGTYDDKRRILTLTEAARYDLDMTAETYKRLQFKKLIKPVEFKVG